VSNVVKLYDQGGTCELTPHANEHVRLAEKYADELIDRLGFPSLHDQLATLIALAYIEGQCSQLKWARDKVRGDG
jgi:hypothetical protein